MDPDRKYVLFVATGVGLGHLLGALLNSAYYAWRTGRALALDMREFHYVSGNKHAGFFEHFSLERPLDLQVITDLAEIDRLRQDDDMHFLRLDTDRLIVDEPFPERVLLIPCLVPGEPYPFSAKRDDTPFRINLRGKLLEAWHAVMNRPEWSSPVIGLHYRSTVGEVAERMTKAITPDYEERYRAVKDNYIATALKVAEHAGYTNPAFLVTSDDMEFVTYVRERLPNAFSLATRLPDQEWSAWVRAQSYDFNIMSEAVNDLWCLSACDHLVHSRSGFSHFAILNSTKLDQTTAHYVHVPALKEILDSLGPEEAVVWARGAVRRASMRHQQQRHLWDWLADALDRVGQTEAAARERQRAQWHWECHQHPVTDNPEKAQVEDRARRGDFTGVLERAQRAVQELPGNPYWLSGYGGSLSTVLLRMGRAQEAIAPARKALEIEPEHPILHEGLATILMSADNPREAERVIRQAIAFDGDNGRFHRVLGEFLMRQHRHADAIAAFRDAVRLEPDDPHLVRKLGTSLLQAGDLAAAETAFRQAIPMRSEASPHIELSDVLVRLGRLAEAHAEISAALALEPTNPHWHNRMAQMHMRAGQFAEAEAAARKAITLKGDVAHFQDVLAQALERQGRLDEALMEAERAAAAAPEDAKRQARLGGLHMHGKRFEQAAAAFNKAVGLRPGVVAWYDSLATAYERLKRPAEGLDAARQAADLEPQNSGRRGRLGHLLLQAQRYPEAEIELRQAIALQSDVLGFHHMLGIVLDRQGRWPEAIEEARRAVELDPDNADLNGRLAGMLMHEAQVDEAATLLQRMVTLHPANVSLHRLLGTALERQNRIGEAIEAARKLVASQPDDQPSRHHLAELLERINELNEAERVLARSAAAESLVPPPSKEHSRAQTKSDAPRASAVVLAPAEASQEAVVAAAERASGLSIRDLMTKFESLGGDCELGLVQRWCGVELLGLMRFSSMPLRHLIRGVETGFAGLAEQLETYQFEGQDAWHIRQSSYNFFSHTFRTSAETTQQALLQQQTKRVAYLRDKLLTDVIEADKTFVIWRWEVNLTEDDITPLLHAMRARGPVRLLWVVKGDPAGTVQEIGPGLMRGYINQWLSQTPEEERLFGRQSWVNMLTNAWLLTQQLQAG